ncbi:MAG: C4-type zinc ribbon domain-containing protein [Candidatus Omnitrophota bacterium]
MDLKSQLAALIKLQTVDSEIHKLKNEKESKPQEIKIIETAFEEKKQGLLVLEKKGLDLQKQRKDKEGEILAQDANIAKLQGQLYSLKTNKEYQTMLHQIEGAKADKSFIEDKVLQLFDDFDKINVEVNVEKERLKGEEKIFLEQKKKVDDQVKEINDRLAQLEAQRKQASVDVAAEVLAQYDRILASRDGLAIVIVKNNSCGGCNMTTPPQVTNLIKMYEHIITCEMCNRMLYVDE